MRYLFLLGRQPLISASEIVTVLQKQTLSPIVEAADERHLVVATERPLAADFLKQLGGTERIGEVIGNQDRPWQPSDVTALLSPLPRKFRLGVSGINPRRLRAFSRALKEAIQTAGSRVRLVFP
jgi:hypothetical protein